MLLFEIAKFIWNYFRSDSNFSHLTNSFDNGIGSDATLTKGQTFPLRDVCEQLDGVFASAADFLKVGG